MTALADQLIESMDLLGQVLMRETELLTDRDARAAAALLERKQALARGYEAAAREWRLTPGAAAECHPDLLDRLREMATVFQELVDENARVVRAQSAVRQKVVDVIVATAKSAAATEIGYAPAYRKGGAVGTYRKPTVTSAALDQRY